MKSKKWKKVNGYNLRKWMGARYGILSTMRWQLSTLNSKNECKVIYVNIFYKKIKR